MVSREDLPPDEQPGRREPVDLARPAAQKRFPASYYWPDYWPYRTVELPCLVTVAAASLFMAYSLVFQPTSGFELAGSAVAWVLADRAVQIVACLATAAPLIAAARRPRWRPAIAWTVWGIVLLQIGSFLLARSEYPGNSCWAQSRWAPITLSDSSPPPLPVAKTLLGARIVVTVPAWSPNSGGASDVTSAPNGILREECTISLPGGGRRTIFTAIKPGTAAISSEEPPSPYFMPVWSGEVVVQG